MRLRFLSVIAAFALSLQATTVWSADLLQVDAGPANQDLLTGWTPFNSNTNTNGSEPGPIVGNFTIGSYNFTATTTTTSSFAMRNRGSTPAHPLDEMLDDFWFAAGADMELTLAGLPAGSGTIDLYLHDPVNGVAGNVDITLTDATGTALVIDDFDQTDNANLPNVPTAQINFFSDGVNPILFDIDRDGANHTAFAGFELLFTATPPPLTPEPGTAILFAAAASLAGGYTWRRRRGTRHSA